MSLSPGELFPGSAPRIRPATGPSSFKSIVCGVDASRSSHEAVAQAIVIGARHEAGQGLVHESTIGAQRAERALRDAVEQAGEAGIDAAAELVGGTSAPRPLLELASHADLLVVASHGGSRRAGIMLGSTASAALHSATVPVLCARRPREGTDFPHRLLVATDGSTAAQRAVELAGAIARRHSARLTLVSVDTGDLPDRNRVMEHAVEATAQRALEPLVMWELGDPAERILATADSDESSLVVLGSRGLSGVKSLGSVSERVAHRARCSVLVVRPEAR